MYKGIKKDLRFKSYGLYAPKSFRESSLEELDKKCGGCGPGKWGDFLIPDCLLFLSVLQACRIHDWMYGKIDKLNIDEEREEADIIFLINLMRIINNESVWFLKYLRRRRAITYYSATEDLGDVFFKH